MIFDRHLWTGEGDGSLARLVLSRQRIEAKDPSLDLFDHRLRAAEHFPRLFGGRLNGVAGITNYPGVFAQVDDSVHKLFQTGIEFYCLAAQPAKVMCLGKWHIGPDKKGLERLLDRLLAMENGIFRRRWLCRQVDSSVAQVVRRFAQPGCSVGQPLGVRLHTTTCPPAERSKAERLASEGGCQIRRASRPTGPPPLRAATTPDTQARCRASPQEWCRV